MEEKSGIEKLVELLNEYEKGDVWSYDEEMGMPYYGWGDDCDYDTYLISKKYGFIKRLVDNDKIERKEYLLVRMEGIDEFLTDKENDLIMLLSVSDEPIQFLISILK